MVKCIFQCSHSLGTLISNYSLINCSEWYVIDSSVFNVFDETIISWYMVVGSAFVGDEYKTHQGDIG